MAAALLGEEHCIRRSVRPQGAGQNRLRQYGMVFCRVGGQHGDPHDKAETAVHGLREQHLPEEAKPLLHLAAERFPVCRRRENQHGLHGAVLPQDAAAAHHQGEPCRDFAAHLFRAQAVRRGRRQAVDPEDGHRPAAIPPLPEQLLRDLLNRVPAEQLADLVPTRPCADGPPQAAAGIQTDLAGQERDLTGSRVFRQMQHKPHPADAAGAVHPPVFRTQPAFSGPELRQKLLPVEVWLQPFLLLLPEDLLPFQLQDPGARGLPRPGAQLSVLCPQHFHRVQLQVGAHPHDQVGHQPFRQPVPARHPHARAAGALGKRFHYPDRPGRPAHIVRQHPV